MRPVADLHAEPVRVPSPPALSDERRRHWLVPTGLLTSAALATFLVSFTLSPALSATGITLVVLFYGAMLVCAAATRNVRNRNLAFAWLTGAIAVTSMVLMLFMSAVAAIG